jgi:hypothetical protein
MVARAVSVFPHEKVVLRRATLYVQEQRITRLPGIFVLGEQGYRGAANNQVFDVSSSGGLALDLPYFLQVTERSSTSVHLQKGRPNGRLSVREGWSLALLREYNLDNLSGNILVDGITQKDVGLFWDHQQQFSRNMDAAASLGWPSHRSLYTNSSLIQNLRGGRLYYSLATDKLEDRDWTVTASADYLAHPRPIARTGLSYRLGTRLMYRKYDSFLPLAPFAQQMSADLSLRPWKPTKSTSIRPTASHAFTWDSGGGLQNYSRFGVTLDQRLGTGRQLSLGYSLSDRTGNAWLEGVRQRLDLTFTSFSGQRWRTLLNASYDLTHGDLVSMGSVDFRWHRFWHTQVFGRYYSFTGGNYADAEVTLGRALGNRQVALVWSAQQQKFALEIGNGFY